MSEFISLEEAADILGVTTRTIRRRIADGSLRAYRIRNSRLIRLNEADVRGLLEPIPTTDRSTR